MVELECWEVNRKEGSFESMVVLVWSQRVAMASASIQERSAVPWSFLLKVRAGCSTMEDLEQLPLFLQRGILWCGKWMRCSKDGFVRICSYRRINWERQQSQVLGLFLAWATGTLTGQCWGPVNLPHCYVLGPPGWMNRIGGKGTGTCERQVLTKYTPLTETVTLLG